MSRSRSRWVRGAGAVAAFVTVAVGWIYGPETVRGMELFRVHEVEVVGTRFMEPYAVVRAAGLGVESSMFGDGDAWRSGIRTLPLVEDVRIRRVYPSTIRLEVREVEPVALVAADRLRPVDAAGRLLELDPAGASLDLPVLTGLELEGGTVADGPSKAAVATVAALLLRSPDVVERVSQAELTGSDLRLTFRTTRALAVIPAAATDTQLAQLRLALADLSARGEMEKVRTLDVRFRDQVVVSFLNTP